MAAVGGSPFSNILFPVLGYAAGTAMGPALAPIIEDLRQDAWDLHAVRKPDALTLAAGVAQGQVAYDTAKGWARRHGFDTAEFDALVNIANVGPGAAYAFELWRRNVIGEPGFRRAVRRLGLEQEWIDDLVSLRDVLLTPELLAQARQRGFVDQARQYAESALQGVTNDRAEIMFESAGLPPPTERALAMWRRGIITEAEFKQTIVEGNEKLKYQDEEAELFRPLLTPATIVNQRLRGWRDTAWMNARLAEHGYDLEQANDLFEGQGRPITFRQVFIGERRGGVYNGSTADLSAAFLKSLQESNIRPEWYALAWAQRHTYPSAFVLRALVQSGDLTADEGYDILLRIGWPQTLARTVADRWGGGAGVTADPHVAKAETQLWGTTHRSFIASEATTADVQARFGLLKIPSAAQGAILELWSSERELIRKQLTPAQVKKAWAKRSRNYATGAAWTRDDAIAALVQRGYSVTEANDFLDL